MSMKMKGLLKGLRYISNIFDEEHEAEMQIGFPTDVKHVAHIGWDGPTANSPSWINQFKDGGGGGGGGGRRGGGGASNVDQQQGAPRTRDQRGTIQEKRLSLGLDSTLESPSRKKSDKTRSSRRATSASDSPRRSSTSSESRAKLQQQLPAEEGESALAGPKISSRRKKTKSGTSGAQSSRVSNRSKSTAPPVEFSHYSDPGSGSSTNVAAGVGADQTTGRRPKGKDTCQSSVLKASSEPEDQKARDDISRAIRAM